MPIERKQIEDLENKVMNMGKKFVRYSEGVELYSMGLHSFQELAKDAGAVYRIKRMVLVNTVIIDEYLESFREEAR